MSGAYTADMAVVDRFRFSGNPKEVSLTPKQQAEYLGFIVNSVKMKLFLAEEKLLRSKLEAEMLLKSNPVVKILANFLGVLLVNSSSHCSGSSPFQKFTVRYDKGLERLKGETRLPECSLSLSRSQERTGMVEGLLKNEQWQKHFAPGRTRHNILRRFQAKVGG